MRKNRFYIWSVMVAIMATAAIAPSAAAKTTKKKTSTPQVIYTGEIAKKVTGYNGTTPVSISISNGRITNITALDNKETPGYFNRAKEKVFKQFVGKSVDEALKLDADIATGATYSSEALIKNIKMGLQQAKGNDKNANSSKNKPKKSKTKSKGKKRMSR